ncbi:anti-anti-sigma factor [Asanoa ferruginea]|uniref:Anti-anti-sigma factor n=1 Tax=Asanoa ferruginea TaxID=53367 RepID=A0A3D9ZFV8_9ACTN|nr:STAS domain-containing protein [Asanoa ferruginea]REF96137.1 anti-anti-sigma factor [Asanoa ferruginea]GIF49280.1 sulfate transporter [Asanoa ferruginea]
MSQLTPLRVDVEDGVDGPVVTVRGDLDFPCADVLRIALASALDKTPARLTLDVERLTFIDSTGLAALVHAWRRGHEAGIPVTLRAVPPFLASILEITGIGELFTRPAAGTREAATA